jgi:hypothetical protein
MRTDCNHEARARGGALVSESLRFLLARKLLYIVVVSPILIVAVIISIVASSSIIYHNVFCRVGHV